MKLTDECISGIALRLSGHCLSRLQLQIHLLLHDLLLLTDFVH